VKIYILTDLEGVAMVSRPEQVGWEGETSSKLVAMRLLTREVNAAVDGILSVDPEAEVIVLDLHGKGGIDVEEFHPEAQLISKGPNRPPFFLDSSFDALLVVGQHAKAGTPDANLAHSYSPTGYACVKLNGTEMGEFGGWAAMAGEMGVPVAFIAGDDKAVEEAKALVPGIFGVAVKKSLGYELALHLSPAKARRLIKEVAAEACRNLRSIEPLRLDPPYTLEIRRTHHNAAPRVLPPGAREIDAHTVQYTAEHIWQLPV
jgi:D-amino peptidase